MPQAARSAPLDGYSARSRTKKAGSTDLVSGLLQFIKTALSFNNTNDRDKGQEATAIEPSIETIEAMLLDHGVEVTYGLDARIQWFATESPEVPEGCFFPVDRVPSKGAKWGSAQDMPVLTIANKPVFIWIVGIVSSNRLHSDNDQEDPRIVSVSVKPFAKSTVGRAEELLKRHSQLAQSSSSNQQGSEDTITAARWMANGSDPSTAMPFTNVFDVRKEYNRATKTDAKRISTKEIAKGDVVLVEALLSRKPLGSSQSLSGESEAASEHESDNAMFTLLDILLLADGVKSKKSDAHTP